MEIEGVDMANVRVGIANPDDAFNSFHIEYVYNGKEYMVPICWSSFSIESMMGEIYRDIRDRHIETVVSLFESDHKWVAMADSYGDSEAFWSDLLEARDGAGVRSIGDVEIADSNKQAICMAWDRVFYDSGDDDFVESDMRPRPISEGFCEGELISYRVSMGYPDTSDRDDYCDGSY